MSWVLPILMLALSGLLFGGAWSMHKQGSHTRSIVIMVVLALMALAGGIMWLVPAR